MDFSLLGTGASISAEGNSLSAEGDVACNSLFSKESLVSGKKAATFVTAFRHALDQESAADQGESGHFGGLPLAGNPLPEVPGAMESAAISTGTLEQDQSPSLPDGESDEYGEQGIPFLERGWLPPVPVSRGSGLQEQGQPKPVSVASPLPASAGRMGTAMSEQQDVVKLSPASPTMASQRMPSGELADKAGTVRTTSREIPETVAVRPAPVMDSTFVRPTVPGVAMDIAVPGAGAGVSNMDVAAEAGAMPTAPGSPAPGGQRESGKMNPVGQGADRPLQPGSRTSMPETAGVSSGTVSGDVEADLSGQRATAAPVRVADESWSKASVVMQAAGTARPVSGHSGERGLPPDTKGAERMVPADMEFVAPGEQIPSASRAMDRAVADPKVRSRVVSAPGENPDASSLSVHSREGGDAGASATTGKAVMTAGGILSSGTAGPVLSRQGEIHVPPGHAAWEQSLARQVLHAGQQGSRQLHIRLNPSHLGSMEIKLQVEGDSTSIIFSSQHAVVREAVEASIPRLREMFSGSGLNLGNVDVSGQDASRGQGGQTGGRGETAARPHFPDGAIRDDQPLMANHPAPSPGSRAGNQLLDYYV